MGALGFFWKCDAVEMKAKKHIYCACVLTILLWGVETWAMTDALMNKLNVFHHRSIRLILRIKMEKVKDEKITNEMVRARFGNIPAINELVRVRKLKFTSHIIRECTSPSTTLTAWMPGSRPRGRPRCTARSTILEHLKVVLPNHVSPDGKLCSWAPFAQDWILWIKLLKGEITPEEFPPQNSNSSSYKQSSSSSSHSNHHYYYQDSNFSSSASPPSSPPPSNSHNHNSRPPSPPPQTNNRDIQPAYHTLGVPSSATMREVTTAYRRLAREFHPDKWNSLKTLTLTKCEERFKSMSNAYECIREHIHLPDQQ